MTTQHTEIEIEGISPLLMHRYPLVPVEAVEKKTSAEQAEYAAYRIPNDSNELYIPGENIQRALISAATYSKGKGRASLQKPAAACLFITPAYVGLGTTEYVVDSRRVVVPATKGAIVRHRPRLEQWRGEFTLEWDDMLLSELQVREIVDNTGQKVGLLDFRPERKGPFGRFAVVKWETLKQSA